MSFKIFWFYSAMQNNDGKTSYNKLGARQQDDMKVRILTEAKLDLHIVR
jgi:hypothetical protein